MSQGHFAIVEAVVGNRMSVHLQHTPFRLTPKMRVLYVKSDLLVDTSPNVAKDGLFDEIEGIVVHFDRGHAHH